MQVGCQQVSQWLHCAPASNSLPWKGQAALEWALPLCLSLRDMKVSAAIAVWQWPQRAFFFLKQHILLEFLWGFYPTPHFFKDFRVFCKPVFMAWVSGFKYPYVYWYWLYLDLSAFSTYTIEASFPLPAHGVLHTIAWQLVWREEGHHNSTMPYFRVAAIHCLGS